MTNKIDPLNVIDLNNQFFTLFEKHPLIYFTDIDRTGYQRLL